MSNALRSDQTLIGTLEKDSELTGSVSDESTLGLLKGTLSASDEVLSGTIAEENSLLGSLAEENVLTGSILGAVRTDIPPYEGEYEVIPKAWEETTLMTQGLVMKGNVVVREITYSETSNPSGGDTVYIA